MPYVSLHGTVYLVDIDRGLRLCVSWVVHFVRLEIANALHVLGAVSTWRRFPKQASPPYLDLGIVPLVHAQRFDLGDVCSQLAVQGCASHAQEDAQLLVVSIKVMVGRRFEGRNVRSNWPILQQPVSKHEAIMRRWYSPGFFAPQSAHVPFPGTVLIRSCSARSLRACCRLFRAEVMVVGREE